MHVGLVERSRNVIMIRRFCGEAALNMDEYRIELRYLFAIFACLCSVGCSSLTGPYESQVSALQRTLGCEVYDASFTSTGELESIKFTSATVVPDSSNGKWGAFRENTLWMKSNSLSGSVLRQLRDEKHLVSLNMIGLQVQPCIAWDKLSSSCVVELNVAATNLDDKSSRFLQTLGGLRVLDLTGTNCGNATAKFLADLRGLRTLRLNGTGLTDEGLVSLADCESLEVIEIRDTAVTEEGVLLYREAGGRAEIIQRRVFGGVI